MLGEKILKLRKKQGLSQEQLGEQVNVTRQTISNWELNETTPNPEQLKLLSKSLDVSIDELLDNEIKSILEERINNTEKLAGIIIKTLKIIGIAFVILLVIDIIAFVWFTFIRIYKSPDAESSAIIVCKMENKKYEVEFGTNDYFKCDNCSNEMKKNLKGLTDFHNIDESINNIKEFFKNNNGICE